MIQNICLYQKNFEYVNMIHIIQSRNGRTDLLAREARTKDYIYSNIDQIQTDGSALRRIGSPKKNTPNNIIKINFLI